MLYYCFAGLHNPVGEAGFRIELEAFVKDKVSSENVIILSVTKASSALDGGDTSVTLASSIVYEADRESERTLTILTKADEVHDTRTNDALVAALKASKKHGCVLVSKLWSPCIRHDAASHLILTPGV
jgi:hypothetical protein